MSRLAQVTIHRRDTGKKGKEERKFLTRFLMRKASARLDPSEYTRSLGRIVFQPLSSRHSPEQWKRRAVSPLRAF
jgi:hypothetical protein